MNSTQYPTRESGLPITLEIRQEFIEGLIPLFLHIIWKLLRQGIAFEEALDVRVDIYRHTSLYDGKTIPYHRVPGWRDERWEDITQSLRKIFDSHSTSPNSEAIEREGYELLRPILEPAFARDIAKCPRIENRPYGFFAYDLTELKQPHERTIEIHMANPFSPESPFAKPQDRTQELRRLVTDVIRDHPDVVQTTCGSWLNSFKPFLDILPLEWAASATPFTGLFPGYGAWGQFVDRRGGFHKKNAEHFRKTGELPYPVIVCQCRIDILNAHLNKSL